MCTHSVHSRKELSPPSQCGEVLLHGCQCWFRVRETEWGRGGQAERRIPREGRQSVLVGVGTCAVSCSVSLDPCHHSRLCERLLTPPSDPHHTPIVCFRRTMDIMVESFKTKPQTKKQHFFLSFYLFFPLRLCSVWSGDLLITVRLLIVWIIYVGERAALV